MNTLTIQKEVAQATRRRGYRDGWNASQFIARNLAKLQEELAEASDCVYLPLSLSEDMKLAGNEARATFDNSKHWRHTHEDTPIPLDEFKSELADMAVVLCNLADAIGELDGQPFDVIEAALEKARNDVERGVR